MSTFCIASSPGAPREPTIAPFRRRPRWPSPNPAPPARRPSPRWPPVRDSQPAGGGGHQKTWIENPHWHTYYDMTKAAFADGPAKVDVDRFGRSPSSVPRLRKVDGRAPEHAGPPRLIPSRSSRSCASLRPRRHRTSTPQRSPMAVTFPVGGDEADGRRKRRTSPPRLPRQRK